MKRHLPAKSPNSPWREALTDALLGAALGRILLPVAAALLAAGGLMLTYAWQAGPARVIQARNAVPFAAAVEGRIVESWIALQIAPADVGESGRWSAYARVTPCAVVEIDRPRASRAFCGNSHALADPTYKIHDIRMMAPGVPFAFQRDGSGFFVPEFRLEKATLDFLASRPAEIHGVSALAELRRRLDRPLELALASWTTAPPSFPLVVDPSRPHEPMPRGVLLMWRTRPPEWEATVLGGVFGFAFWVVGMNTLLFGLNAIARVVIVCLTLLTIPWWAQGLTTAAGYLDDRVAVVLKRYLADIDVASQFVSSAPQDALLHDGERLTFGMRDGFYAETMASLSLERPQPTPATSDAALALLAGGIAQAMRALPEKRRIEIFDNLTSDRDGVDDAVIAFFPAGKMALTDRGSSLRLKRAADRFLVRSVYALQRTLRRDQPAFAERVRLFRSLMDVPSKEISDAASFVLEEERLSR